MMLEDVEIVPWTCKQLQVVSKQLIYAGEIVMQEDPLIFCKFKSIQSMSVMMEVFQALINDKEKLEEFKSWNLHCAAQKFEFKFHYEELEAMKNSVDIPYKELIRLWMTFAVNAISSDFKCGILKVMSRVNHSCLPNCAIGNNFTLVAIKNIKKGESITYDYYDAGSGLTNELKFMDRTRALYAHGFLCSCAKCKIIRRQNTELKIIRSLKNDPNMVEVNWK